MPVVRATSCTGWQTDPRLVGHGCATGLLSPLLSWCQGSLTGIETVLGKRYAYDGFGRGNGKKQQVVFGAAAPRWKWSVPRAAPAPAEHPGARLKFRGGGCPGPLSPPRARPSPPPAFKSSGAGPCPRSAMAAGPEPGPECGICYEAYWGAGGGPQQLPCRHSLCQRCLRRLVCRAATVAFISCPFCRMVTLLPERAPVTADPGSPPGEQQQEHGGGAPPDPGQGSSRSVAALCSSHAPVFAVSSSVSPCGPRRGSEASHAFVLGLLGRGLLLDTQPPLASMENLRLGFAAAILVLIVSTFFLLVFLK